MPLDKPPILAHKAAAASAAILAAKRNPISRGQWAAVVVFSLSAVAAFGIAPDTALDTVPTRTVVRQLAVPMLAEHADSELAYWREERVQRGDTIGSLLARAGMDDVEAMQFMRTSTAARPLYQLRPGRAVRVATDDEGELIALRFMTGAGDMLSIERHEGELRASRQALREDVRTTLRSGEIRSSLFAAADAAGLPDPVTTALADIFAGDIDFYHDLRRGDRFTVVYETRFVDGEAIGTGRILAAEFENRGVTLRAFLWRDPDGNEGYFDADGRNIRTAFLRSPMEFSRITSGFTLARFHPILQSWRAHQGIDYAAPSGTVVRATADGVVTFAGVQNGYGNVIFLRHQGNFTTVYAHLSRFDAAVNNGARVRQGATIGYVGMTGWATGPHLHYEFRVADQPRDPVTVALPSAPSVAPDRRVAFRAEVLPFLDTLALARALPGAALASTE